MNVRHIAAAFAASTILAAALSAQGVPTFTAPVPRFADPNRRAALERAFPEVDRLFQPIRDAEARMGVNDRTWPKGEFTLDQVDFLNRNPRYPEWRAEGLPIVVG